MYIALHGPYSKNCPMDIMLHTCLLFVIQFKKVVHSLKKNDIVVSFVCEISIKIITQPSQLVDFVR